MVYIVFLVSFFFACYRDLWKNPPLLLQSIANFLKILPERFLIAIGLILIIQFFIKGLTSPPIHFQTGDTYFLFALPIPKKQYIYFEYALNIGKILLMLIVLFILAIPIFPLIWENWFVQGIKSWVQLSMFAISLINLQWLAFQLPSPVKRLFLKILRYIKITFYIVLGSMVLFFLWFIIFSNTNFHPLYFVSDTDFHLNFDLRVNNFLLLLFIFVFSSVFSMFFMQKSSLESLRNSSLRHDKIKTLFSLGMEKEGKNFLKGREKKYFFSIPGFYKKSKIFFWRSASQFIKQPLGYLSPYITYFLFSVACISFTKGEEISLLFVFLGLYILGQTMISPLKSHYRENYFLSIFPIKSIYILRGYLILPLIFSIIIGMVCAITMGWFLENMWFSIFFILNIPFFSYYTLLGAMGNVLEDISWEINPNKTLKKESILIIQGAAPIIFGILFSTQGIPVEIICLCTAVVFLLLAENSEKDITLRLQEVFGKYA